MEPVDYSSPAHAPQIATIGVLANRPEVCRVTKTAMRDLTLLGITKANVLDSVLDHLRLTRPLFFLIQAATGRIAYVFLPCCVEGYDLYVKIQISTDGKALILISAHPPIFSAPAEVKK